jgi:hypothetical protein
MVSCQLKSSLNIILPFQAVLPGLWGSWCDKFSMKECYLLLGDHTGNTGFITYDHLLGGSGSFPIEFMNSSLIIMWLSLCFCTDMMV